MSTKAPAQACLCQSSYGEIAYAKIWRGKAAMGSSMDVCQKELPKEVKSNGAVSPAALAIASKTPVMIPPEAVRNTICKVVFHLDTPRASDASLDD